MPKSSLQVIDADEKKSLKKSPSLSAIKITDADAPKKKAVKKTPAKKKAVPKKKAVVTEPTHDHSGHVHKEAKLPVSTNRKTHKVTLKREPLGHLLVEKLLKEAGFHGGVSTDKKILDRYSNDESIFTIRPQIVLQPKSQKDVEVQSLKKM
jgi:hypothetical protein